MKKIKLTNADEYALVDDDIFEYLSQFKWRLNLSHGKIKYAVTGHRPLYMHRLIMGVDKIKGHSIEIDHINKNGLDNTGENLRKVTGSQNQLNTDLRKNNTTGFKGIWFDPTRNKWQAHLRTGKKLKRIGRYSTKEEAASAYKNYVALII